EVGNMASIRGLDRLEFGAGKGSLMSELLSSMVPGISEETQTGRRCRGSLLCFIRPPSFVTRIFHLRVRSQDITFSGLAFLPNIAARVSRSTTTGLKIIRDRHHTSRSLLLRRICGRWQSSPQV